MLNVNSISLENHGNYLRHLISPVAGDSSQHLGEVELTSTQ